ncbi:hypothetical protein D9M71_727640 [compost metagenome]
MNMKIQGMVLNSGLPEPRRMLPYLLKMMNSEPTTKARKITSTGADKRSVADWKSWLATCSERAGKAARAITVRKMETTLTTISR